MKTSFRFTLSILILIAVLLATTALVLTCAKRNEQDTTPVMDETSSHPVERVLSTAPGSPSVEKNRETLKPEAPFTRTSMPPADTNGKRRLWLRAEYGDGPTQLGKYHPKEDGEIRPPQSFALTGDDNLLVLDSAHKRLVFYDSNHRFERAVPISGLIEPAEVAVADDGTVVLQDHSGLQTRGMQILDPTGTRVVADFPDLKSDQAVGVYTSGKDIFYDTGLTSTKVAQTDGQKNSATPELYQDENGVIPGRVGPDGVSILSAGIDDFERGEFSVTLLRGKTPEHLFTRHFSAAAPLDGLPYFQMDDAGNIYVVVDAVNERTLLCLNSAGEPVGRITLPRHQLSQEETPFRSFSVVPSGGLLYRILSDTASTWELFDCH